LTSHVCALAASTEADVIVLNENAIPSQQVLSELHKHVSPNFFIPNATSEKRFHCYCRRPELDMSEVHSGFRTSVRTIRVGTHRLLLAIVHGVDARNYDSETRQSFAQSLSDELKFVKQERETSKLVVIGDFNMNPFDRGMNLAAGLNAMMTRECVAPGVRRHLNQEYDLYYNPMWSLFGDISAGPAGTVFDTSSQGPYGWSMFDQVVLNHSVVELFEDVQILTDTGEHSLMNEKGRPDTKTVSDHFPIMLTLREEIA